MWVDVQLMLPVTEVDDPVQANVSPISVPAARARFEPARAKTAAITKAKIGRRIITLLQRTGAREPPTPTSNLVATVARQIPRSKLERSRHPMIPPQKCVSC